MTKKTLKKSENNSETKNNKMEQSEVASDQERVKDSKSKGLSLELKNQLEDRDELRKILAFLLKSSIRPNKLYEKAEEILKKSDLTEEDTKFLIENCMYLNSYDKNHYILAETENNQSKQSAIIEYANDLIKEYDCKTPSEKALCEIVTNSYFQTLRITAKMTGTMNAGEYLSEVRNGYINVLSKELERANRSYLMALNTLREMRSPQMNINIKTKTAFIGTNQQFNNNSKENENIKD